MRNTPFKPRGPRGRPLSSTKSNTLPRRSRNLPTKLQDYVSNDYMSQLEIAEKLSKVKSKPTTSPSPASESGSSIDSSEQSSLKQEVTENTNHDGVPNGGISERVKRKRGKQEVEKEEEEEFDADDKDNAIYVTELSIDGIPTVVIESAITLTEQEQEEILKAAAATGSIVAPVGSHEIIQRVSLNLNSDEEDDSPTKANESPINTESPTLSEGRSSRSKLQQSVLSYSASNTSLSPSTGDSKRKRGRPRKTPLTDPSPGSDISMDCKRLKFDDGDQSDTGNDEKLYLVSITDINNVDRVFSQQISLKEAKQLNLKGFNVDEWRRVSLKKEPTEQPEGLVSDG